MQSAENVFVEFIIAIAKALAMAIALLTGVPPGDSPQPPGAAAVQEAMPLELAFSAAGEDFVPAAPVAFSLGIDGAGQRAVIMQLTPGDADAFGDYTVRHVGQEIALSVCGEVLIRPRILDGIYGGRLVVSGDAVAETLRDWMENGCP